MLEFTLAKNDTLCTHVFNLIRISPFIHSVFFFFGRSCEDLTQPRCGDLMNFYQLTNQKIACESFGVIGM